MLVVRSILILLLCWKGELGICEYTFCAYEDFNAIAPLNVTEKEIYMNEMGVIFVHNKTVRCPTGKNICFTAWKVSSNISKQIMKQGCWTDPADSSCFKDKCLSDGPPKGKFSSLFCCCQGSYCNTKFTQIIINETKSHKSFDKGIEANNDLNVQKEKKNYTILNFGIKIMIFAVAIIVIAIIGSIYFKYHKKVKKDYSHYSPALIKDDDNFNINNVHLLDIIDRGRYGTIWKAAYLKEEDIVVKVFKHVYQSYFLNERDIYKYPHMHHPNILKFIGSGDTIDNEKHIEHWLALAYVPQGCLQNYLKEYTLFWSQFINIFSSISAGLSYLQKIVVIDGKVKPPIAHRDLNTRNILITDDGNRCIIGDLGFAYPLITNQCKVIKEGQKVNGVSSGEKTLVDVGTIRYMAPEVLEGSINLRDCEAALKQVDLYALALVMWEVSMRCRDLCQEGEPTADYQLPFQSEIGLHPTFEDMQILVVRNKCRPSFPPSWQKGNEAISLFKETLEHCWDHDAEARLSAFCVEERVSELRLLWTKIFAGDFKVSTPASAGSIALAGGSQDLIQHLNPESEGLPIEAVPSPSCATDKSERGNSTTETYLLSSSTAPLARRGSGLNNDDLTHHSVGTSYVSTDVTDQSDKRLLPLRRPLTSENAAATFDERGVAEGEGILHRSTVTSLLMKPLKGFLSKANINRTSGHYNNYSHHHNDKGAHFL